MSLIFSMGTQTHDAGFWSQLMEILTFRAGYNTTTVVAGTTLLGIAAGVVGVFAMLRKRALVCDALSHATLPGICIAFLVSDALLGDAKSLPLLLVGAAATGVIGVLCIQAIVRLTRLREDAAIGIVLSVFFGMGMVLLGIVPEIADTPAGGINHFIYGQTAAMRRADAILMGVIALGSVGGAAVALKEFSLVSFDEGFARSIGWRVGLIDLLMMALVVAVTVAGLQAVGLLLVVAMLIVPPAAARFWSERMATVVILSGLIGGLSGFMGSAISAMVADAPAGAVIVLTAGAFFTLSMVAAPRRGVVAAGVRRARLRLQIATDHVLESITEVERGERDPRDARRPGILLLLVLRIRRLVEGPGSRLVLSELGRRRGARVHRNHRLWEQYLISYADVAPSHVDWSVDKVEHVLAGHLVEELEYALIARGVPITADGAHP